MQPGQPSSSPPTRQLFLDYAGQRYVIHVPRFIVGREQGACHLVLNDSNVSRQHAVIEHNAGQFFMVDLGSRNGIGYNGQRIHKKQIAEGDRFDIGSHSLHFSFHNP